MKKRKKEQKEKEVRRVEVADFETTVYAGQKFTEVWCAATVQIGTEDVHIFHSIGELFDYYCELDTSLIVYFHNLKFDGQFILYYLQEELKFKQAIDEFHNDIDNNDFKFLRAYRMPEKSFLYTISDKGQWYGITVKVNRHLIEFRDSLKLLPFSVREIGNAFKTRHRKKDMEYKGFRYAGCEITKKEREYIANDVLVVKEALEFMFSQGHDKLTIGACCLSEFKNMIGKAFTYQEAFPNLYEIGIDESIYGSKTAGDYILRSYRGGWCYLAKGCSGVLQGAGTTADVNSLYPSMMHSQSGNRYPFGLPNFWSGDFIPPEAERETAFYFIRIATRFYLKPGKLPFIQIKRCTLYKGTECLETSDYVKNGTRYRRVRIGDRIIDTRQTMTMTMVDFKLFLEHYDTEDFEILDGCWFYTETGLFDVYIDRYKKIKQESKGAMRTWSKLMLNNLYGKLAATTNSSFKVMQPSGIGDGILIYRQVSAHDKTPGYIACGSAITSYARNFTIRAAQANYHPGKPGFIYADTDSIHCNIPPEQIQGIRIHDKDFCAWKIESCWDYALFLRQKTYIEHVIAEDMEPVDPYNDIKCAGMTKHCKMLLNLSLEGEASERGYFENGTLKDWTDDEKAFLFYDHCRLIRSYHSFRIGLRVPGKLLPKTIRGGVVLMDDWFTIH